MEHQPWAVFSDVVEEVTRAPVDEVRTFLARRTESDALLVAEIRALRQELAELRDRAAGGAHAAGSGGNTLAWLVAAAFAGGDLYFLAALLTG